MTIGVRVPTETEMAALKRRRQFHEKIAARAAALNAPPAAPPAAALEPEAMPAETDPPAGYKTWFTIIGLNSNSLTIGTVKAAVAFSFNLQIAELSSHRRHARLVLPRQVAMWLCKELIPEKSFPQIGRAFGKRDHTTVMHACRVAPEKIKRDPQLAALVASIRADLEMATPAGLVGEPAPEAKAA
jgi:hypothetical protein